AGFLHYPNGIVISGKRYFGHTLGRGDIITWENDSTRSLTSQDGGTPAGLLKRLIGLPGDTVELRDGVMYLNGEPQKEPYTAKPHSSFGEKFLKECQVITVPEGEVFAMGDNRKGSADSREIGFAPIKDIDYVLPLSKQKGVLDKNWRDTSKDLDASSKVRLDKTRYVELLNEKRKDTGAKPLKYQPLLEKSAFKRGEVILKYDDFSYEATRSGYTQLKAMNEVGYSNIVYGEAPALGYYEAEELIDNQFEFPDTKKFLLNKEFQEVGVSEVEKEVNGCPTQVLVQHFAGYVPPNYKTEDIESWKTNLSRLREIQPSWARLKENSNFYQKNKNDVDRINEIISTRIANISSIVARMESNQWLTATEQRMVNQDKTLYDEQEAVATRLNSQ
ncbi:signal peptidase I, partial [Candidatus Daviesbacteria bacterium]|nr:signal peptidase I [Candidatus Daviesbacteria bacterium]